MKSFNDYIKEAALSAKQKKIAAIAGDKDKIDADDLAALRAGKKPVDECDYGKMKKEELVGNQYKLDKNKNGKIDSDDLKKLRGEGVLKPELEKGFPARGVKTGASAPKGTTYMPKKAVKEEIEQIDEAVPKHGWKVDKQLTANMDAPKHKHNKAYTTSASAQHSAFIHKSHDDDKWHVQIGTSDGKAHYKAFDSYEKAKAHLHSKTGIKEEVEQIDELSKKTLGSYVKKASHDARMMGQIAGDFENRADRVRKQSSKDSNERLSRKYLEKAWKRDTGIGKAVDKLTKEEVEQIDEGKMKDIYTSMMHHADKKGYTSHKQFTPADYDAVGKEHGISGSDLAIIAGHKTAAQVGHERAHQLALKGMKSLSKEEVERIEEKLAQMDETVWDGGAAERQREAMRNRKPDLVSLGGREPIHRKPDLVGRPTKPDTERDELKNFHGYKQNTGKHVANVDKAVKYMHNKSAADKHPVPAHAPVTAADKKAPHKVHSNPFAKGYHGQDKHVHEEVEQIDELSKKTLGSYAHKATDDAQDKAHDAYDSGTPTRHELEVQGGKNNKGEYAYKPLQNRLTGIARAAKKLGDKSISKSAETSVAHHLKQRYHYDNMDDGKAARSDDAALRHSGKAHEKIHKASGVKEEVSAEMSPYLKATLAVMDEGKMDDYNDMLRAKKATASAYDTKTKVDTSHPAVTVHKGTAYGGSAQKDDETDEKPETKEKRSAGRPSGTSTGARLKGSKKEKDDIDGREYSLHLPK